MSDTAATLENTMVSTAIEQARRAVVECIREFRPDGSADWDDGRALRTEIQLVCDTIDLDLAIRGFSIDISGGDAETRQQAADALGWLGDERGISALLRGLDDMAPTVRMYAAVALAQFSRLPDWVVAPLADALRDANAGVRAHAATALGQCRSDLAVAAVVRVLDDASGTVRSNAARALEELGLNGYQSDVAIAKLSANLDDDQPRVAYDAFWGLRGQAGSASDERCSAWRWSPGGQRAWGRATRG
jgi:HEAT repeat protein